MSWFSDLFKNPSRDAMKYFDQIPAQTKQYMDPFYQAGKNQIPHLEEYYSKMMGDPGGFINKMGESYKQSPGAKAAIAEALEAAGSAEAAGGMAGTPQHQYEAESMAHDLSNKDYYNYMDRALGMFGEGLHGGQDMMHMGQQSGKDIADMIAQAMSSKAGFSYAGNAAKNQQMMSLIQSYLKAMGAAGAGVMGGM